MIIQVIQRMRIEQFFKFTNIVRITQNISYCFVSECIIYSIPNDRSLCRIYLSTKKIQQRRNSSTSGRIEGIFFIRMRGKVLQLSMKKLHPDAIYIVQILGMKINSWRNITQKLYIERMNFFFFQFNHSSIGLKKFKKKTKNQIAQNSTSPSKSIKSANPQ